MKVKALGKDWEVKNPTYKEKRELHYLSMETVDKDNSLVKKAYAKVLNRVEELSGLKEEDFKDLSMIEVDELLNAIHKSYEGLDVKKSGD